MKNWEKLQRIFIEYFFKIKKFTSLIKLPYICLFLLLCYFSIAVYLFNKKLVYFVLAEILNVGSYHFDAYWGTRDWYIFLKKNSWVLHKIIISFSTLFFVLYRYFLKYPEIREKYINIHVFDLLGFFYSFIYFNFINLGTVMLMYFEFDYKLLGLISTQWLDSYTFFPQYQTVFGLISVTNFFILLSFFLNFVLLHILISLVDKYLI